MLVGKGQLVFPPWLLQGFLLMKEGGNLTNGNLITYLEPPVFQGKGLYTQ